MKKMIYYLLICFIVVISIFYFIKNETNKDNFIKYINTEETIEYLQGSGYDYYVEFKYLGDKYFFEEQYVNMYIEGEIARRFVIINRTDISSEKLTMTHDFALGIKILAENSLKLDYAERHTTSVYSLSDDNLNKPETVGIHINPTVYKNDNIDRKPYSAIIDELKIVEGQTQYIYALDFTMPFKDEELTQSDIAKRINDGNTIIVVETTFKEVKDE